MGIQLGFAGRFWGFFWDLLWVHWKGFFGSLWSLIGIYPGSIWDLFGINLGSYRDLFGIYPGLILPAIFFRDLSGISPGSVPQDPPIPINPLQIPPHLPVVIHVIKILAEARPRPLALPVQELRARAEPQRRPRPHREKPPATPDTAGPPPCRDTPERPAPPGSGRLGDRIVTGTAGGAPVKRFRGEAETGDSKGPRCYRGLYRSPDPIESPRVL